MDEENAIFDVGAFSWVVARQLAELAAAAYSRANVKDARTNAQALVTLNGDGDVVVAFKGSSSPRDFLQDAKFLMRQAEWSPQESPALVHAGFLEDFMAIAEATVSEVRRCRGDGGQRKIYVTGHSLGGALAILGALELRQRGLPVAGVYTFGQPRVGNGIFVERYEAAGGAEETGAEGARSLGDLTYRVVNQNDIVPRTPGWLLGYRHCGQELFLPVGGGCWLNPSWLLKLCSDLIGLYGAYRKREDVLVREHFMGAYENRIQNPEFGTDAEELEARS